MTKMLTTNHAVVHTATVDIRILRIGEKQMTLSVFRQLPQKSIFRLDVDEDVYPANYVQVNGTPWGVVRYRWSDTPTWGDYYLVWESEGTLYRMCCPKLHFLDFVPYPSPDWETFDSAEKIMYVFSAIPKLVDYCECNYEEIGDFEEELKLFNQVVFTMQEKLRWFEALPQLFIAI